MISIYVTDYSGERLTIPGLQPIPHSATWCPAGLHAQILRIDLFLQKNPGAREWALSLEPGQIWTFVNMRLKKYGSVPGLESSLKEYGKARKIDEKATRDNVWARALLQ